MRKGTCKACEKQQPLNSLYRVNDSVYCEACGNQELQRLAANKELRREVQRLQDPTVCSKCEMDNGNSELQKVSEAPFCSNCHQSLYTTNFPGWLRATLAALAALFLFAVYHGRPYFHAEEELVRGDRLIDSRKYADAVPHLEAAFNIAPRSEHVVLSLGKALYLSGDYDRAGAILEAHGNFETSDKFREVQAINSRVAKAFDQAKQGDAAADGKHYDEAIQHFQAAMAFYPEYSGWARAIEAMKISAAFDQKNYDEFVRLSEAEYKSSPQSPENDSMLASALACKYAATGDMALRSRAEELLKAAEELSKTPEQKERFQEYAPRIRYRLESRVIIDKDEYDRRFRPELVKAKTEKKG